VLRTLTLGLLTVSLVGQAPRIEDLLSEDWRIRRDTTRALAALPADQLDLDALLRVLRTNWPGELPRFTLGGGRGGFPAGTPVEREPRARIQNAMWGVMLARGEWWHRGELRLTDEDDLGVPWPPRALAAWLIERRATAGSMPQLQVPLDDERSARVWLLLAAPPVERVHELLADARRGRAVASALHGLGRDDVLGDALAAGNAVTRSNVLAINHRELLERDDCLAAAIDLVLHEDDHGAAEHVAELVKNAGDRGLPRLVEALRGPANSERALYRGFVLLCGLRDVSVAQPLALEHIEAADPVRRERALYLLGENAIVPELRHEAATRLLQVIERSDERDVRLLALDALGQCGEGVEAQQRQRLRAMLDDPKSRVVHARVLGCLRMLGAAGDVPLATRQAVAKGPFPMTATWLALADEGAPAANALARLLPWNAPGLDGQKVVDRMSETAPEVVRSWLFGKVPPLQQMALAALRKLEPESGVTTAQLLELLAANRSPHNDIIRWLAHRDDVGDGAAQVYAWMAAHGDNMERDDWHAFAIRHPLPTAQLMELLGPRLQQGYDWRLVLSGDREMAREACRAWYAAAADDATRARLAGALCQLGVSSDADVAIVLAALQTESCNEVLYHLDHVASPPVALRARIEELAEAPDSYTRFVVSTILRRMSTTK
jgi:hypothetical protein